MVDLSSGQVHQADDDVDELDADERGDDAADAVDERVACQQRSGADGPVGDAAEGERDQGDDDERVEDDGREDGALGASRAA